MSHVPAFVAVLIAHTRFGHRTGSVMKCPDSCRFCDVGSSPEPTRLGKQTGSEMLRHFGFPVMTASKLSMYAAILSSQCMRILYKRKSEI